LLSYGKILHEQLTLDALADVLREQVRAVNEKKLARGEAMLAAQAHTLDAIYNVLLRKAIAGEKPLELFEAYMRSALRAQSQCRATWEAISAIQNPPIAGYVKQANIANNQQVNNDAGSRDFCTSTRERARTRKNETAPNKLLEQTTHEPDKWMDRGAPGAAARSDSPMEAVGTIDRAKNSNGQS
jgi:hypothetical protein